MKYHEFVRKMRDEVRYLCESGAMTMGQIHSLEYNGIPLKKYEFNKEIRELTENEVPSFILEELIKDNSGEKAMGIFWYNIDKKKVELWDGKKRVMTHYEL